MKVRLENISLPRYANVPLARGEAFLASPYWAKLLVLMGMAKLSGPPEPEPDPEPEPEVATVQWASPKRAIENVEISPRTGKPKRQYRRRDMRAER